MRQLLESVQADADIKVAADATCINGRSGELDCRQTLFPGSELIFAR